VESTTKEDELEVSLEEEREERREETNRSPIASCMSLAATEESTPPLTAPMTCPFSPQIALILEISFSMKVSCRSQRDGSALDFRSFPPLSSFETHHSPISLALADTENEVGKDLLSLGGVGNLGVELDSVNGFRLVGDGGERSGRSGSDGEETFGKSGSLVSVRHPDL